MENSSLQIQALPVHHMQSQGKKVAMQMKPEVGAGPVNTQMQCDI